MKTRIPALPTKNAAKKLTLARETLRALDAAALAHVAGGYSGTCLCRRTADGAAPTAYC
jgi:hypothetical protein